MQLQEGNGTEEKNEWLGKITEDELMKRLKKASTRGQGPQRPGEKYQEVLVKRVKGIH